MGAIPNAFFHGVVKVLNEIPPLEKRCYELRGNLIEKGKESIKVSLIYVNAYSEEEAIVEAMKFSANTQLTGRSLPLNKDWQ